MTEPLSPAAQAVLDATDYPEDWATRIRVAAALQAAADQVVPEEDECMRQAIPDAFDRQQAIRAEILAIAAELGAQP